MELSNKKPTSVFDRTPEMQAKVDEFHKAIGPALVANLNLNVASQAVTAPDQAGSTPAPAMEGEET